MTGAPPQQAIPIAAAQELDPLARRTAVIRYALAGGLALAVIAAVSFGRNPEKRAPQLFPGSESGVLVLDISASIGAPGQNFLNPLEYLSRTGQNFGLVFFSDVAYEALPPGTSSEELRPYIKIFEPPIQPCAVAKGQPCPPGTRRMAPEEVKRARRAARRPNPWSASFRGGTRISMGLHVARDVLRREGITHQGVLLVSDLDDSFFDLPVLTREIIRYNREKIPVHIVALDAAPNDAAFFRRLLGSDAFVTRADLSSQREASKAVRTSQVFPIDLATVGLLALLLLALNEHFCGRLTWRRLRPREARA